MRCRRARVTPDEKRINAGVTTAPRVPHPPPSRSDDWDGLLIEAYQCPRGLYLVVGLVPTDACFRDTRDAEFPREYQARHDCLRGQYLVAHADQESWYAAGLLQRPFGWRTEGAGNFSLCANS